jgi:hypothetical protein
VFPAAQIYHMHVQITGLLIIIAVFVVIVVIIIAAIAGKLKHRRGEYTISSAKK